jgi:hypothetical protein
MRADSGLTPGLSDSNAVEDGELALDPEGRSGEVEHAARATSSAAKVRGQTRRGECCPATPRTLSASPDLGPDWPRRSADKVERRGHGHW